MLQTLSNPSQFFFLKDQSKPLELKAPKPYKYLSLTALFCNITKVVFFLTAESLANKCLHD